jgi:murein DD-endopeptidase MepM/ murein hydrolase activator NlpD
MSGIVELKSLHRYSSIAVLLVLSFWPLAGTAQENTAFRNIVTEPQQLQSGSPCIFSVEMAGTPTALTGKWLGHDLSFFKHGNKWYALSGVDVETAPGTYDLVLDAKSPGGKVDTSVRSIVVHPASYRTVNLTVEQKYVEPDADTLKVIAADKVAKDAAFAQSSPLPLWSGDFLAPVRAAPTDSFGTRRTFNGKLASIHRGMDYRAATGTPVNASNSGVVILARKLFFEGNCVAVDHGQGFQTVYMHLSRLDVTEGQRVAKGQRLGLSGATGRATGPHLHFAARWQGGYVDPARLLKLPLQTLP